MDFWKWSLFRLMNPTVTVLPSPPTCHFGSYYVKERTTNGAYILSDQKYPVVFEYAGQETALVQILVNEGEAVCQ